MAKTSLWLLLTYQITLPYTKKVSMQTSVQGGKPRENVRPAPREELRFPPGREGASGHAAAPRHTQQSSQGRQLTKYRHYLGGDASKHPYVQQRNQNYKICNFYFPSSLPSLFSPMRMFKLMIMCSFQIKHLNACCSHQLRGARRPSVQMHERRHRVHPCIGVSIVQP